MIKNTEEWNGSGYSRIADGCVTFCLGWGIFPCNLTIIYIYIYIRLYFCFAY